MTAIKKSISIGLIVCLVLTIIMPSVSENSYANSIKLSVTNITMVKGDSKLIRVVGSSAKVTWSSNNKNVATVGKSSSGYYGKITAKKNGTATITAKVNGKRYTCKVTVADGYTLSQKKLYMSKGTDSLLKVIGTKKNTVKWSTSDSKVVTVSSKGVVTAKKVGNAEIHAKVAGKTLKCKVTVSDKYLNIFSRSNVGYGGKKYTLKIYAKYKDKAAPSKGNYVSKLKIVASDGSKTRKYEITPSKKYDDMYKVIQKEAPKLHDSYATYFEHSSKLNLYKGYYKSNNNNVSLAYEDYTTTRNNELIEDCLDCIVGPFTGESMLVNSVTLLIPCPIWAALTEGAFAEHDIYEMGDSLLNIVDYYGSLTEVSEYFSYLNKDTKSSDLYELNKKYFANLCKKVIQHGKPV